MNYLSLSRLSRVLCVVLLMAVMAGCNGHTSKTTGADTGVRRGIRVDTEDIDITEIDSDNHEIDSYPSTDGSQIFLTMESKLRAVKGDHPTDRTYELNGEAWFFVHDADKRPVVIHTRLLTLTIQSPYARLHIDAFASSPGEQADLLEGQLKAAKSYHSSTDNEPEILKSGDMVMINKDIDLMEKETLDSTERKAVERKFPKPDHKTPRN